MKYSKAEVANVDFAFAQTEGLMFSDGSYGIGVRQANECLKFVGSHRNANRAVKSLLGEGYTGIRMATELNSNKAYVLTLDQFKQLIRELDKRGNPVASAFVDAMITEAIERRFDHAFNVKRSEEERNERAKLRMSRLLARSSWTDTLKQRHTDLYGFPPSSEQYKQWTGMVNLALFKRWHFYCDRDNMTTDQQRIIEQFEFMCCRMANKHPKSSPDKILDIALSTF